MWKPFLQQLSAESVIILWTTSTGMDAAVYVAEDMSYSSRFEGTSRQLSELGTQLHRVELTGLQPDTTYYYKVTTDNENLVPNEELFFSTAPATGSSAPFTFLVFGDYGRIGGTSLRDQMLHDSFDFILTTCDNAYNNGQYSEFDSNVIEIYGDVFSRAGLFPALGDHDYGTDEGAPYLDIFELPEVALRDNDQERYYSFDYGNVHFVILDSVNPLRENDQEADDDMFDWLRKDLDDISQPWNIVAFQLPVYSSLVRISSAKQLVPILEEFNVDLVFNEHSHLYERSFPLLEGEVVEENGIVYVISGAGYQAVFECNDDYWIAYSYCGVRSGMYARVTVDGDTLTIEAIDENGDIWDQYSL